MGMVFTGLGREADGRAGASLSLLRKRTHLEGWGLSREMAARAHSRGNERGPRGGVRASGAVMRVNCAPHTLGH